MPQHRAVPVTLTAAERRTLKKRARGARTSYRDWLRAQIVLLAARHWPNAVIARRLRVSVDTVRKWRGRFAERGLDGLADLPRCGRPRRIGAGTRRGLCAGLPAACGHRGAAGPLERPGARYRDHQGGLAAKISP